MFATEQFQVIINGVETNIPRPAATGQTYGVLTAIADMPGREGVKVLILGFLDENGSWVYQPFAVNLSKDTRTQAGDYMFDAPNIVVPAPEGYYIRVASNAPVGALHRFEYDLEMIEKLINHDILVEPPIFYIDQPKGVTGKREINFSQYMIKGVESVERIQGSGGEAENSPLNKEQSAGQGGGGQP